MRFLFLFCFGISFRNECFVFIGTDDRYSSATINKAAFETGIKYSCQNFSCNDRNGNGYFNTE